MHPLLPRLPAWQQTEMPLAYYSMPFCRPPEGVHRSTSTINPGTILLGIRIENSPYNFTVMVGMGGCSTTGWNAAGIAAVTGKSSSVVGHPQRWAYMQACRPS